MKFQRKFGQNRKTNPKRGLFLVLLLVVVILLWYNAEKIIGTFL